ncbi:MAG: SPOR domain-containing protein [Deltaproteobacteria bacterium]|nr:SPOR domain-containing protein [Deltaproteobacteria bacterium]
MSDEEKSIEEIIAELESIEKRKSDEKDSVEHDETVLMNESAIKDEYEHPLEEQIKPPEKLTLEQPYDELFLEKPLEDRPPEALLGEESLESIFDEKASSAVPTGEVLEESHEKLVLEEPVEEEPREELSETIFEKAPHEELILDEPFEEKLWEKPPEEVFGEEPLEELIFEKPVEEGLSEIAREELRKSDIQEEQEPELPSEKVFTVMEEERPPEGPPPDEYGYKPPDEPPLPPEISKPPRVSRTTILLGFMLMVLILVACFVWPTMYEYGTTTVKGNKYKVRINRLTSVKEYDVMGKWQSIPPSEKSMYRARIKVPSTDTKATAKTAFEKAREMAKERAKAKAKTQAQASLEESKTVTVKVVEKQPEKVEVTVAKNEPVKTVTESAPTEPIKATKEVTVAASIPPVKPASPQEPAKMVSDAEKRAKEPKVMVLAKKEVPKPEKKGEYAIQIASMRFEEFAEELVENLGKKGFEGHMDTVTSKRGGVWHTVLIGHFSDKGQALAFMKEKKITETYPGCYIRKLYNR